MAVAECGGEPTKQKWAMDEPEAGFISNAATKACINVIGCEKGCTSSHCTKIVYDPCETTGNGTCGCVGTTCQQLCILNPGDARIRGLVLNSTWVQSPQRNTLRRAFSNVC
jgi:hypothetical protein